MRKTFAGMCRILLIVFLILIAGITNLFSQDITVKAEIEKGEVFLGESFIFQISIQGSNSPEQPDTSGITDFDIEYQGGYDNSSSQIIIINGQVQQSGTSGYKLRYKLTPKRTGILTIPSIKVKIKGKNYLTDKISIKVSKPEEVGEYKLRLSLSNSNCYVGEMITATVTWYISRDVKAPIEFTIPLFEDTRIKSKDINNMDPKKEYVTITLGNEQVNFEYKKSVIYGGNQYDTLTFKKVIIPKQAGRININPATVGFNGVYRYVKKRDWFGRTVNQPEYRKFVIPSNSLSFNVKEMPGTGKPPLFSGLVGKYSIEAKAAPLNVKVGDPITLTLILKSDVFLEDADLPPLYQMPSLSNHFKIPKDIAPGEIQGNSKVFTQTLRALNVNVKRIPEIKIPYFNTRSGKYEYARTKPIPITVEPAAGELSVLDMEGSDRIEIRREIEVWEEGIAHNYESDDVLINQAYGLFSFVNNPVILFLIIFPAFTFLVLLYIFRFSPLVNQDRSQIIIKQTFDELKHTLKKALLKNEHSSQVVIQLMENLKNYLGAKLKIKGASLTFKDVEPTLLAHGISEVTVAGLKTVFDTCEASHYAGGAFQAEEITALCEKTSKIVDDIERNFL